MYAVSRNGYKHLENTKTKNIWICFSQFLKSIQIRLHENYMYLCYLRRLLRTFRLWKSDKKYITKPTQKFAQMGKIGSLDENDAKVMWSDQTAPMSRNCTRLRIQSRFDFQVTLVFWIISKEEKSGFGFLPDPILPVSVKIGHLREQL